MILLVFGIYRKGDSYGEHRHCSGTEARDRGLERARRRRRSRRPDAAARRVAGNGWRNGLAAVPIGHSRSGRGEPHRDRRSHERSRWHRPAQPPRMFTARATTNPTVTSAATPWMPMRILAVGVRGIVSVGLNAVELVSDV